MLLLVSLACLVIVQYLIINNYQDNKRKSTKCHFVGMHDTRLEEV